MKVCYICKKEKSLDLFNKNKHNKDGLQDRCRECDQIRARQRYRSNPEEKSKAIARKQNRILENRNRIYEYLKDKKCDLCPYNNILGLDFDHLEPNNKIESVSTLVANGSSWIKIREEIDKCRILCACCHREYTAKQLGWYKYGLAARLVEQSPEEGKVVGSIPI